MTGVGEPGVARVDRPIVAGVDIGGTKIAVGAVSESGALLDRYQVHTPAADGPDAVLNATEFAIRALRVAPHAIGVGSAGAIDVTSGSVVSATAALPGWAGTELRQRLAECFGVPVAVDNDVHAHALGEMWRGAAVGRRHVLLVAVGTGIGGSLVVDGAAYHGGHSVAGHIGHTPVPAAAEIPCGCGATGHAEAVGSGPAMLAAYQRRGHTSVSDLSEITRRAGAGDRWAAEVLVTGGTATGQAVGGLVNVLDPELVLLTGGVLRCGAAWWEPFADAVAAELLPPLRDLTLMRGKLGSDAALIGAARLAWDLLGVELVR